MYGSQRKPHWFSVFFISFTRVSRAPGNSSSHRFDQVRFSILLLTSWDCGDLKAFARPHAYLNASGFCNQFLCSVYVVRMLLRRISRLTTFCKCALQMSLASCQDIHQVQCLRWTHQYALHELPNFRIRCVCDNAKLFLDKHDEVPSVRGKQNLAGLPQVVRDFDRHCRNILHSMLSWSCFCKKCFWPNIEFSIPKSFWPAFANYVFHSTSFSLFLLSPLCESSVLVRDNIVVCTSPFFFGWIFTIFHISLSINLYFQPSENSPNKALETSIKWIFFSKNIG